MNINTNSNQSIKLENPLKNAKLGNVSFRDNQSKLNNEEGNQQGNQQGDSVFISKLGKENSHIASLMKQKQFAMEKKQGLMSANKEKDSSPEELQEQLERRVEELKVIEEEIRNLDSQIAKATSTQLEKEDEKKKDRDIKEPKTEEEVQSEKLANMTKSATDIEKAEAVLAVKKKVEGEIGILESEIKQDNLRFGSRTGKKEVKLVQLKQRLNDLIVEIGEKVGEVLENQELNHIDEYNKELDQEDKNNDEVRKEKNSTEEIIQVKMEKEQKGKVQIEKEQKEKDQIEKEQKEQA